MSVWDFGLINSVQTFGPGEGTSEVGVIRVDVEVLCLLNVLPVKGLFGSPEIWVKEDKAGLIKPIDAADNEGVVRLSNAPEKSRLSR